MDQQSLIVAVAVFIVIAAVVIHYRRGRKTERLQISMDEPSSLIIPGLAGLAVVGALVFGYSSSKKCHKRAARAEAALGAAMGKLDSVQRLTATEVQDAQRVAQEAQHVVAEAREIGQAFAPLPSAPPLPA